MRLRLVALLALLAPAQERSQSGLEIRAERPMIAQPERARHGMIASVNELATQAGLEVLRQGGNAIDAAVAVGAALAVVHPEAGNLGGGGYMVIRMADGRVRAIDYKETAPALATLEMFKDPHDLAIGYKASGVPGTVAGFGMAHANFGKLPWRQVLEPAYQLASRGFPVSQRVESILRLQVPVMKAFPEAARIFLHGSEIPLKQDEVLQQPELARTIRRLQQRGWREFYEGETAKQIDADMRAHNGTIRFEDLRKYTAKELEPLRSTYRGFHVLTAPPSSAGGFTLLARHAQHFGAVFHAFG